MRVTRSTSAALSRRGLVSDVLRCQYERTQLDSGAAVYAALSVPKHYVCPYCLEQMLLRVLQYRRVGAGSFAGPGCQTSLPVTHATGVGFPG
jgi:hypothetical protein